MLAGIHHQQRYCPRYQHHHRYRLLRSAAALIVGVSWPVWSSASPVDEPALGKAVFTGPAHPHPTSILVNPAALAMEGGVTFLYLGGGGQYDHLSIQRQRITDPAAGLEPGPASSHGIVSPNGYLIGQYRASKNATLAGAFSLPVDERFTSGDEEHGYHTLGGHHRQWTLSVATSVRLSERLYIGAGISWVKSTMSLSFLRDTALEAGSAGIESMCGDAPCGIENPLAAERWSVNVDSEGFLGAQTLSIRAGLVYQPFKNWWFGASYHSPPGLQAPLSLSGRARIERAPIARTGEASQDAFEANAEVIYELPPTLTVGVRGPVLTGWQLVVNAAWRDLSRHDALDVRVFGRNVAPGTPEWYPRYRGYRDTVSVQAGMESAARGAWRYGARLRFEYGAMDRNAISPGQIDGTSLGGSVGAEWRILNYLVIGGSYGFSWLHTPPVTDSAYDPRERLTCVDGGFVLDDCISTVQGRAISSAAGTYSRSNHALHISLRAVWL